MTLRDHVDCKRHGNRYRGRSGSRGGRLYYETFQSGGTPGAGGDPASAGEAEQTDGQYGVGHGEQTGDRCRIYGGAQCGEWDSGGCHGAGCYIGCRRISHEEGWITDGDYRFHFAKMLFYRWEEQIELSKGEQKLLRLLIENRGITLTRDRLLECIWSVDAAFVDENTLSVTVKRLRDKLGVQERIKTEYGLGYRWE